MFKKLLIVGCSLMISTSVLADDDNKSLTPGTAKVKIEAEEKSRNTGEIKVIIPAIDIYGFDKPAQTPEEKQKVQQASQELTANIADIVVFNKGTCAFMVEELKPLKSTKIKSSDANGEKIYKTHYYMKAEFNVKCDVPMSEQQVNFNFNNKFPSIKNIDLKIEKEDDQDKHMTIDSNAKGISLQ